MPIFNLQLEFDDSGAVTAIRRLNEVSGAADKASHSTSGASRKIKNLSSEILGMAKAIAGAAIKITAVVGGLGTIGNYVGSLVQDSLKLAEQLDELEAQMNVLGSRAGWTADEMSNLEQVMIKNGVDAVDARKNVIAMTGAYVDAGKSVPLFKAALDATVVSGKSVNEVIKTMTEAFESGNAKTLESLGITANFNKAYEEMADSLHTSVSALTEHEKAQARVDAALKASADNAGLYEQNLSDAERASNEMNDALTSLKMELADIFS